MRAINNTYGWMIYYIILQCTIAVFGAVMHKNYHDHNGLERQEDGAYSPKLDSDKHHYQSGDHRANFDHEAILGSTRESEEYDTLPPEESKRRLKALLLHMDKSQDGFIDRSELRAWITKSFYLLSMEEANEKFEETDENNDGNISWKEYLLDSYGSGEFTFDSDLAAEDLMLKTELDQDKDLFEAVDKNKDGLLNAKEFAMFANPEEYEDLRPLLLGQILFNKDNDKDGAINFQEFVGKKGYELSKESLITEKHEFDEYDLNKDGKLTELEIIYWVFPQNEKLAEEEATHLFAQSDDNHDDLLSFDEILEHHDVFVGSEATNYGDQLHNFHEFVDEL